MNNEHNFAGYIEYHDNQYFCTVNDYVIKIFYKDAPGIIGLEKNDCKEDKYLYGISENDCPFAVFMPQGTHRNSFSFHVSYHFSTPIFIKAKSAGTKDLSFFDGIEFYGDTVNKIFNPRQAVKRSEIDPEAEEIRLENIVLMFKPHSDYGKEYGVVFDGQEAKIEFLVYRYINLAEQRNEDGSISLGSLNSAVRIKFESPKSLDVLKRYWLMFNDFLMFLVGRQNVNFGLRLFQKNESDTLSHIADGFFRRGKNDVYNDKIQKTIQLNELGDKFPNLFELFTAGTTPPFLRFLPENNEMANRISDADVLNICTAFEIVYGLDKTEDKENIVNNIDEPEFREKGKKGKGSILSRRIWFLCHYVANLFPEDKLSDAKKSIADFVKLRNNIIHNGTIDWGNCGLFSRTLIKVIYVNILLRAKVDRKAAIKIAERKWGE